MADLNRAISTAVKTGKVLFGVNTVLNSAATGKVRLLVVASNLSEETRDEIQRHCEMSGVTLVSYPKSSVDLGRLCGKPFSISALAIRDPGDSEIMALTEEENV